MFVVDESKIVNGTYKGVMQVFSYDNANEIELPWSGQFLVLLRNQFGALPVVDYFEGNRYKLNEAIYHYRGSNVLEFIKVGVTRKTMVLVPLSVQVSAYNMENNGIKGAYVPELEKEIQKVLEVIRNSGTNVTIKEKAFLNNLKFIEKELTDKTNVVFGKVEEVLNEVALVEQESERFLSLVRENELLVDEKYHKFDTDITEANQTIDDILALQPQFQAVLDETTGKDVISAPEIILARGGEADLKTRLDKEHQEVTAQLAQTMQHTNSLEINAKYPPEPLVGMKMDGAADDTVAWQNLITFCCENKRKLVLPEGTIKVTSPITIPVNQGFWMTGAGNRATRVDPRHNGNVLEMTTGQGYVIENIMIAPTTADFRGNYTGIFVKDSIQCHFNNIAIFNSKIGVVFEGMTYTSTTNELYIYNGYEKGVFFKLDENGYDPSGNRIGITSIQGHSVNQVGFTCIYIEGGNGNVFENGGISQCEFGVYQEIGSMNHFKTVWAELYITSLKVNNGSVVIDNCHAFTANEIGENATVYSPQGDGGEYQDLGIKKLSEDKGLKALWMFNEGEGARVLDKSGNGKHATLNGTPTWSVEGRGGIGAYYNLNDGRTIQIPYDTADWTKPYTVGINYTRLGESSTSMISPGLTFQQFNKPHGKWFYTSMGQGTFSAGLYTPDTNQEDMPFKITGNFGSKNKNVWAILYVDPMNKKVTRIDPYSYKDIEYVFENEIPLQVTESSANIFLTGRNGIGSKYFGVMSLAFVYQRKLTKSEVLNIVNAEKPFSKFDNRVNLKTTLVSPNGSSYKITVDDSGVITSTLI